MKLQTKKTRQCPRTMYLSGNICKYKLQISKPQSVRKLSLTNSQSFPSPTYRILQSVQSNNRYQTPNRQNPNAIIIHNNKKKKHNKRPDNTMKHKYNQQTQISQNKLTN